MKGRHPTSTDLERMQQALALVTAYDEATETDEFELFRDLISEDDGQLLESTAQFAWLLLRSIEASSDVTRDEVLQWYGLRFARGVERTEPEP